MRTFIINCYFVKEFILTTFSHACAVIFKPNLFSNHRILIEFYQVILSKTENEFEVLQRLGFDLIS